MLITLCAWREPGIFWCHLCEVCTDDTENLVWDNLPRIAKDCQTISVSDLRFWAVRFTSEGWPMPRRFFRFNATSGEMEVYRVDPADGILVATRALDGEWTDA